MKNLRLLSTTAAVLLLGAGAVSAQGMKNDEAPGRAPAAQQNAPAEKMAPALKSGQRVAGYSNVQGGESHRSRQCTSCSVKIVSESCFQVAASFSYLLLLALHIIVGG